MKSLLPAFFWPLNIFQLHGCMCCSHMYQNYYANKIGREWGCFEAKTIYQANVLIIWGHTESKMANLIEEHINYMLKKRFIVYLKGCHIERNQFKEPSFLSSTFVNAAFCGCNLDRNNYRALIKEARQCLAA